MPKRSTLHDFIRKPLQNDHYISLQALAEKLGTDVEKGLTSSQARDNLEKDGPNAISIKKGYTYRWMRRACAPFSVMLVFGGVLAFVAYGVQVYEHYNFEELDYVYSGFILLFVAIVNAACFMYEHKAQTSTLEKIYILWPRNARVIRDGKYQLIPVSKVVVGDVVEVQAGQRFPADLRLMVAHSMTVENHFLSSDKTPSPRDVHKRHKNILHSENMAFLGTKCVEGFGRGIVVATGDRTIIGRLAKLTVVLDRDIKPPLAYEIRIYDKYLALFVTILTTIFVVYVTLGKHSLTDMLINTITTIASNIPEGLIPTIGVVLTVMVQRLGRDRCLIKHLMALDTLGLTSTVILRTRALTTQHMYVSHLWIDNDIWDVGKNKDDPVDREYMSTKSFADFSRGAILSNIVQSFEETLQECDLEREFGIDSSILVFMEKTVGNTMEYRKSHERVLSYPFNVKNGYSVTIYKLSGPEESSEFVAFVKGSPEILWKRSSTALRDGTAVEIDDKLSDQFWKAFEELGGFAEIVVGLCDYKLPDDKYAADECFASTSITLPESGLRFLGMISLYDPPKKDSIETIVKLRHAGIKVILASGAHNASAVSIAKDAGLIADDPGVKRLEVKNMSWSSINIEECRSVIITRDILSSLTTDELDKLLGMHSELLFTRVTPHQKVLVVDALQRKGETVALVGHGTSEAVAIKKANIGVAMARCGSDEVMEMADMVLIDNRLSSVVKGIESGRLSYINIKKALLLAMSAHIPEMLPFFLNMYLEFPMPLMAKAFLFLNIGIDIFPAISIGFEKEEDNVMLREPRRRENDRLFSLRLMFVSYLIFGLYQTVVGYINNFLIIAEDGFTPNMIFKIKKKWDSKAINDFPDNYNQEWTYYHRKRLEDLGQTAYFNTIVVMQFFNAVMCKTFKNSIFQQGMRNWYLNCSLIFSLLIAVAAVYIPYFNRFFRLVPMPVKLWFVPVPFALWLFAMEEVRKWYLRRLGPGSWLEQFCVT